MKTYRGYIVLGKHKQNGKYVGYVENSFNMELNENYSYLFYNKDRYFDYENFAKSNNIDFSKTSLNQLNYFKAKNIAKTLNESNNISLTYKRYVWKAYRINSKHCPVNVDFTKMNYKKYGKFSTRNIFFTLKNEID